MRISIGRETRFFFKHLDVLGQVRTPCFNAYNPFEQFRVTKCKIIAIALIPAYYWKCAVQRVKLKGKMLKVI